MRQAEWLSHPTPLSLALLPRFMSVMQSSQSDEAPEGSCVAEGRRLLKNMMHAISARARVFIDLPWLQVGP